jgi:hypothetical protein
MLFVYTCQNCGFDTMCPVQTSPDPNAPCWCHDCAYEGVPEYREFIDEQEARAAAGRWERGSGGKRVTLTDEFAAWDALSDEAFWRILDSSTACPGIRNELCPKDCSCTRCSEPPLVQGQRLVDTGVAYDTEDGE